MLRKTYLAIALLGAVLASPAFAEDACTKSGTLGVGTGYVYSSTGGFGTEEPVTQNDITIDCGNWSYNLWMSAELTGRGPFGHRGGGDEIDATVTYNNTLADTGFDYSIEAAYYLIGFEGPNAGFGSTQDDFGFASIEVGRPFSVGTAIVRPLVAFSAYIPVDGSQVLKYVRTGADITLPLAKHWSVSLSPGISFDLNGGKRFDGRAAVTYTFDNESAVSAGIKKVGPDQAGLLTLSFPL